MRWAKQRRRVLQRFAPPMEARTRMDRDDKIEAGLVAAMAVLLILAAMLLR